MKIEIPHGMGRIKSEFDKNDYRLRDFIPKGAFLKIIDEKSWEFPSDHLALDQGDTPHCVGFSMADFGINLPVHCDLTSEDGHKFYYKCKELDGRPNSEEGSTVRTAAKVLQKAGRIEAYAFALDMDIIKWWLLNRGPLIVGTIWTKDMFTPDENNIIHPSGDIVGGHAYLINEWRIDNYIGIQNSWGTTWGNNGKAYISNLDFEKIFKFDGEAMTAVELENFNNTPTKKCFLMNLLTNKRVIKRS